MWRSSPFDSFFRPRDDVRSAHPLPHHRPPGTLPPSHERRRHCGSGTRRIHVILGENRWLDPDDPKTLDLDRESESLRVEAREAADASRSETVLLNEVGTLQRGRTRDNRGPHSRDRGGPEAGATIAASASIHGL